MSTAFGDWIERDLLQIEPLEIDAVNLRNYSLDRTTGRVDAGRDAAAAEGRRRPLDDERSAPRTRRSISTRRRACSRTSTSLTIVGVLPKPAGITATLRSEVASTTITAQDHDDLARKGFYLATNGQLVSNRGEMVVQTSAASSTRCASATSRPGTDAPAADPARRRRREAADAQPTPPRENRYLFIMVDSRPRSPRARPAAQPKGRNDRSCYEPAFAPWYYVIAANSFSAIQLKRSDLVNPREH